MTAIKTPDTGLAGARNYIINGNFDYWQRGTSLGAGTGVRFLADRFLTNSIGSTVAPSRQAFVVGQADVPGVPTYFHRAAVVSSAGASNLATINHNVESVRTLAGRTATLSFWAKADSAKNVAVEFVQNFGTGGSPSAEVNGIGVTTLALTSSWKKFTATVSLPSVAGKTLGSNGNDFLLAAIWLDAGSSFNSRTNSLGQQSGTFDIAQVMLNEGPVAAPFVLAGGTIGGELALCQWYFRTLFEPNKDYNIPIVDAILTSPTTVASASMPLSPSMRAVPTYYENGSGSNRFRIIFNGSNAIGATSASFFAAGTTIDHAAVAMSFASTTLTANSLPSVDTLGCLYLIGADAEL